MPGAGRFGRQHLIFLRNAIFTDNYCVKQELQVNIKETGFCTIKSVDAVCLPKNRFLIARADCTEIKSIPVALRHDVNC